ncbi:MAG: transcriptional repressor LexA [Parachlamydiales bacterium]
MHGLTSRQREVLDYINTFIRENRYSPSYREIMEYFGLSSLGSVYKFVHILKRKGFLAAEKSHARSIAPIHGSDAAIEGMVEIPFLGTIIAGKPIETFPQTETLSVPGNLVRNPEKSYVLQVRGDSMVDAQILEGDLVIVEATNSASPGDTVVALLNQSETTLKRYQPDGDYVRLEPANPAYQPIVIRKDSLTIQGVVTGLYRCYV